MYSRHAKSYGRFWVRGFTLVELMVTIALLAIISAIALPSYNSLINSSKLVSAANNLNAAIQQTRIESMRRNQRVALCGTSNSNVATPTCSGTSVWSGWLIFTDTNQDGVPAASDILARGEFKAPITVAAKSDISSGTLFFRPDGFARAQGATAFLSSKIRICIPTTLPADNIRDVVISSGSRLAIDKANGGGACAAP